MPIIASAKKRMRQNERARVRNHSQTAHAQTLYKNVLRWAEEGDNEKVDRFFADTQSAIDTCAKKGLIHKNTAARKKSRLARIKNTMTVNAPKKETA